MAARTSGSPARTNGQWRTSGLPARAGGRWQTPPRANRWGPPPGEAPPPQPRKRPPQQPRKRPPQQPRKRPPQKALRAKKRRRPEARGRRAAPSTPRAKYSKYAYGVILMQINPATRRPEALLVCSRYSYEYGEFVHGRYSRGAPDHLRRLVGNMRVDERLDLWSLNFDLIWYRIWLTAATPQHRERMQAKFEKEWMRDGGEALRALLRGAGPVRPGAGGLRWEFPKGKRRANEPDINCAAREFEEEAGVAKRDYRLLNGTRRKVAYVDMDVRYVNTYYFALARRPLAVGVSLKNMEQAAEIAEVRWMDIEQIRFIDAGPTNGRLESVAAPAFAYLRRYLAGRTRHDAAPGEP